MTDVDCPYKDECKNKGDYCHDCARNPDNEHEDYFCRISIKNQVSEATK